MTSPIIPQNDVLNGFERKYEDGIVTYSLRTELDDFQTHWVSIDATVPGDEWNILAVSAPLGSFSIDEAVLFAEELNRCIEAAKFLSSREAVAA